MDRFQDLTLAEEIEPVISHYYITVAEDVYIGKDYFCGFNSEEDAEDYARRFLFSDKDELEKLEEFFGEDYLEHIEDESIRIFEVFYFNYVFANHEPEEFFEEEIKEIKIKELLK